MSKEYSRKSYEAAVEADQASQEAETKRIKENIIDMPWCLKLGGKFVSDIQYAIDLLKGRTSDQTSGKLRALEKGLIPKLLNSINSTINF